MYPSAVRSISVKLNEEEEGREKEGYGTEEQEAVIAVACDVGGKKPFKDFPWRRLLDTVVDSTRSLHRSLASSFARPVGQPAERPRSASVCLTRRTIPWGFCVNRVGKNSRGGLRGGRLPDPTAEDGAERGSDKRRLPLRKRDALRAIHAKLVVSRAPNTFSR